MEKTFITTSAKETTLLGEAIGKRINQKCVIAFTGGMGSGKTHFTAGLCKGLGYIGDVTSPTFAIVNEYLGGKFPVYHFDMYRINDEDELYSVGFYDYLEQNALTVIEWSENISPFLPDDTVYINFFNLDDYKRKITVTSQKSLPFIL